MSEHSTHTHTLTTHTSTRFTLEMYNFRGYNNTHTGPELALLHIPAHDTLHIYAYKFTPAFIRRLHQNYQSPPFSARSSGRDTPSVEKPISSEGRMLKKRRGPLDVQFKGRACLSHTSSGGTLAGFDSSLARKITGPRTPK